MTATARSDELSTDLDDATLDRLIDYWDAANYLTAAQIYPTRLPRDVCRRTFRGSTRGPELDLVGCNPLTH